MLKRLTQITLVRFAIVGGVGFLVDAGVLTLVLDALGPYLGRVISFLCAALTTWIFNRIYTFAGRQSGLTIRREFTRYLVAMLVGGAVNYGVYALLIAQSPLFADLPVLAVAAGSLSGMTVNFILARFLIFSHDR